MPQAPRPSMRQLIQQRRRAGFVGRGAERAAFRANFDLPPDDERHRFRFHVHGNAGVGKTFLVRELEQQAKERGALTAYVDEGVGSVPEALTVMCRQFASQGRRFKELERLLAAHRERRHEAESAVASLESQPENSPVGSPSAGSLTVARIGLAGAGLIPVVGPFAGALDADRIAQGADRVRAGIAARLRNQDDVQLVLAPERVLTPVLLTELDDICAAVPWIVLFLDTYERTGPFLDGWLHDIMTTDRYGDLSFPANLVLVTAGQRPFDTGRWGGFADFVTEVPLGPFTEAEARGLLADKGVTDEPVVEEVLRLTGGLPVLVSTLAEARPTDPDDIGDPSATAVGRFLKWETDPARQAAALACALPRRLDADIFRAALPASASGQARDDAELDLLFGWLRALPFVSDRGDRIQYHDVVRAPMLRLQRHRSPRRWAEQHTGLADTFAGWRAEVEVPLPADELWATEEWRELRLAESYHLLCASPRTALPVVLRDVVHACDQGEVVARRWARVLVEAGDDNEAPAVRSWGRDLLDALADADADDGGHGEGRGGQRKEGGVLGALALLLGRAGLDARGQAVARMLRGRELRMSGEYGKALGEYEQAVALDPGLERAYYGRGVVHAEQRDYAAAIADLDRADELAPDTARVLFVRGDYHRILGHHEEAVRDLDRAIALGPDLAGAWASRGVTRHGTGDTEHALADLDRALELDPEHVWALVRRARVHRSRGERAGQLADLDRAVALGPELAWVACERGDALRAADRDADALDDYDRALELDPAYSSAYASRGVSHSRLGCHDKALADLDKALELYPAYAWALVQRSVVHRRADGYEASYEDAHRAVELEPESAWALWNRGEALRCLGRFEEARADLDRALALAPDSVWAIGCRGAVLHELRLYGDALADLDRTVALDPDGAWHLMRRIMTLLAVGRPEDARTDLHRYLVIGDDRAWAHHTLAQIHLLDGRAEDASTALAEAARHGLTEPAGLEELARAQRKAGEWRAARETADRMRGLHGPGGVFCLALAVAGERGRDGARPVWREADRLASGWDLAEGAPGFLHAVIAAGRGDWAGLDEHLADLLTGTREWVDVAWLADLLSELAGAPGGPPEERERIAVRLDRVREAREAISRRYAE
ncbi:tetratricopeptide repeat protein [Streptomyces sp. SID12501]|uniref:Tetratricopeptide repeat protein n=1 Tax=Streptomyces sp. SID12501 TaxID=2706042 RepID=A0A6B3BQ24_9ACTN|nr:tetratricopeptide repeat protein [Streptomyces sp. SID12501]NEC86449.1 tetratricopeptide repeat protein [Streptomyces sp. SID12501]